MSTCTTKTMDKAELEKYLQERYGDKIGPAKQRTQKERSMRGYYEQMSRPHRRVNRYKDGRLRVTEVDGSVSWR